MSIFESTVIGFLVLILIGMFLIGRWIMVIMINSRLVNRKIDSHNLVDLKLRFFRFLHFNGYEKKGSGEHYLGEILETFMNSNIIDNKQKDSLRSIYHTFLKNQNPN
mgnify:CR=1 FL=1